jgi:hypothetical protein
VRTGPDYFTSVLHDLQVKYTSFLVRTVREAVAAGELPPDTDVEMVRSMVYGGIEHRMWATLFGRGAIDVERLADDYTEMVLCGLLRVRPAAVPTPPILSAASRGSKTCWRRPRRQPRSAPPRAPEKRPHDPHPQAVHRQPCRDRAAHRAHRAPPGHHHRRAPARPRTATARPCRRPTRPCPSPASRRCRPGSTAPA